MPSSNHTRRAGRAAKAFGAALLVLMAGRLSAAPVTPSVTLPGHIPALVGQSQVVGQLSAPQTLSLTLVLPLRNQTQLTTLMRRLYDKQDPLYGQYLTPDQFTAQFGPTQADYNRLINFAQSQGLSVTKTFPGRTLLNVKGTSAQVTQAFSVGLNTYLSPTDGRHFFAPNANPRVPSALTGVIAGVVGLDNAAVASSNHIIKKKPSAFGLPGMGGYLLSNAIGSGPLDGLTPIDIKTAYNLTGVSLNGAGRTLALFELDGFTPSDITAYQQQFNLPLVVDTPPPFRKNSTTVRENRIQALAVNDNGNGTGVETYTPLAAGDGAVEVTLDIQMMLALAPNATQILVYEAPLFDANGNLNAQGIIEEYQQIATDNRAKEISSSWFTTESGDSQAFVTAESQAFMQMITQGQTLYIASGDDGAYGDTTTVSVQDPSAQPYVTAVGGTTLATSGPSGLYVAEKTWGNPPTSPSDPPHGTGGGGGFSRFWTIPSYQTAAVTATNTAHPEALVSTTMRNVPDVSLDSDPNSGYAIYFGGEWGVVGGTSCAAPLWAGFTALVNQQRVGSGAAPLGFANYPLYALAATNRYTSDFHDIVLGDNLFYPAVPGYDDATGLGTFLGEPLLNDLVGTINNGTAPGGAPTTQVLGNPGFENGVANPAPWVATGGVVDNSAGEAPHGGTVKAWFDGYGVIHVDTLAQTVAIPVNTFSQAANNPTTLTFFLHVDTAERSKTQAYDTLKVQIRNASGNVLATLATYSNLNAGAGYVQKSFDVSAFAGQTVQLYLVGQEDSSFPTSFVVDDFALNAPNAPF